jgi:hypothetical protein
VPVATPSEGTEGIEAAHFAIFFGVQFLDAARMTYWGKHQDTSFWIENASVEWKESEAPFHNVARLTLLGGFASLFVMGRLRS